jgi:DNA-binding LytR/AlgR family response regulator
MENIRVLIVEDKSIVAAGIEALLKRHSLEVIGICDTGEEAIRLAAETLPDLILMDIELAGAIDGIAAAKIIQENQDVPIIYLTDFTDDKTVDRAKKTFPANYISKPFQEMNLIRAIDLAFHNANVRDTSPRQVLKKHVFVRTDNQVYVKLAYQEILYLKADRAYCDIVTDNKTYKLTSSMNHVHEQLNNQEFVRIHRSSVVNLNRITALDGNMIKLGELSIQMSGEYRETVLSSLRLVK